MTPASAVPRPSRRPDLMPRSKILPLLRPVLSECLRAEANAGPELRPCSSRRALPHETGAPRLLECRTLAEAFVHRAAGLAAIFTGDSPRARFLGAPADRQPWGGACVENRRHDPPCRRL